MTKRCPGRERLLAALLLAALLLCSGCGTQPGAAEAAKPEAQTAQPAAQPASSPAEAAQDPTQPQSEAETPAPAAGGLLDEHWFDDALFLGDSLTGSLNIYNIQSGGLGDALIFHVNGLACHHIIEKDTHFNFKGQSCSIEEAAALSGAAKLFLMLAMNDVGTRPIEQLHEDWALMLGRIRERCPELAIYVQSGTPLRLDVNYFTRENMADYNRMLREVCDETGCVYVDITPGLADEDGYLKDEYRLDDLHLNPEGCAIWVENLRRAEAYSVPPVTEEKAP